MISDQFIKYNVRNIFFKKNNAENEVGKQVPDLFLFSKIALDKLKASRLGHTIKKKLYNVSHG